MIKLMRLNGTNYILNSDLIETVEATPDTVITTTAGVKYICRESVNEVVDKVIEFKGNVQIYAELHKR